MKRVNEEDQVELTKVRTKDRYDHHAKLVNLFLIGGDALEKKGSVGDCNIVSASYAKDYGEFIIATQMSSFDDNKILKKLNISSNFNVLSLIAVVDYEKGATEELRKMRRQIEKIFFYDKWLKS